MLASTTAAWPFKVIWRADGFANSSCQDFDIGYSLDAGLNDGELVAPDARDGIDVSDAAAQSASHGLKQIVTHVMPERVVHTLEMIEVEVKHRQAVTAMDSGERVSKPFAEQYAVGQIGKRIVAGHVRDLLFCAPPLGDVLMSPDPAAARHRTVHDGYRPSVGQFEDLARRPASGKHRKEVLDIFIRVSGKSTGGLAMFEEVGQFAAGFYDFGRQSVHLIKAGIAYNE